MDFRSILVASLCLSFNAYANNDKVDAAQQYRDAQYKDCDENMSQGDGWENIKKILGKDEANTIKAETCSCAVDKVMDNAALFMSKNKTAAQKNKEALLRGQILNDCVEQAISSIQ